jgi:hypothetical protein
MDIKFGDLKLSLKRNVEFLIWTSGSIEHQIELLGIKYKFTFVILSKMPKS